MSAPLALALDIGATKLAVGLVDADGVLTSVLREPTRRDAGPDAIIGRLFAMGERAASGSVPTAVGISCGGPLDAAAGVLLGPLHLPGWDHVEIVRLARERFGVPARLVNDASAGAWGEFRTGAAVGSRSSVYLTLSSGMGGGAVLDGRLLWGATSNGGEFGHVCVRPGGRRCTCGRLGCVEAYIAGTQIVDRAQAAIAAGRQSSLADLAEVTAVDIVARHGEDALATELWDEGIACLAQACVDIVNLLEPEVLVLGGGLTGAGELLFAPVRRAIATQAMRPIRSVVRVAATALGGGAPAIGAGLLALEDAAPLGLGSARTE